MVLGSISTGTPRTSRVSRSRMPKPVSVAAEQFTAISDMPPTAGSPTTASMPNGINIVVSAITRGSPPNMAVPSSARTRGDAR